MPFYYIVKGIKHSIETMIAPSGETTRVFATYNRQTFRARYVAPNIEPETLALGRRCSEVFAKPGWRGPLNIQCQLDRRGRVTIHEFNGRFGALAAERWLLGYDEVAHGIELFTGLTLPPTTGIPYPLAARWHNSLPGQPIRRRSTTCTHMANGSAPAITV